MSLLVNKNCLELIDVIPKLFKLCKIGSYLALLQTLVAAGDIFGNKFLHIRY